MRGLRLLGSVLFAAFTCALPLPAQSAWQPNHQGIGFGQPAANQSVQLVSSPELTVPSASSREKLNSVELRFVINIGLHINSHTPNSHYLIPTSLTLTSPSGVSIAQVEYPEGLDYHFRFAPKDALNVYTGEFGVRVHLHAKPGEYRLQGQLRYQACDNNACNPPKTLPLTLDLTAK